MEVTMTCFGDSPYIWTCHLVDQNHIVGHCKKTQSGSCGGVDQHWKKSPSKSCGGVVVEAFAVWYNDTKQCVSL